MDKTANTQKFVKHPYVVVVPFAKDITRFMQQAVAEERVLVDPVPQCFSDNRVIRGYVVALRGDRNLVDLQTFAKDFGLANGVNIRVIPMTPEQRKFLSAISRGRQNTQVSASRTLSEVLSSDSRYFGKVRNTSEQPALSFG